MGIKITDIRKGRTVTLRNGMTAEVRDNMTKAQTRLCMVYGSTVGLYDELGSVYSTDIVAVQGADGWMHQVEHTPGQLKAKANRMAFGF
jgi:hypothetical protein